MPPTLNDSELTTFLHAWVLKYPKPKWSDAKNQTERDQERLWLATLVGRPHYKRPEMEKLVAWKFKWTRTQKAALTGVSASKWKHASSCIRTSLHEAGKHPADDATPLARLMGAHGGIRGWGPAMASALLAASDPARFTIADSQAQKTLRALRLMTPATRGTDEVFHELYWLPYLDACRHLATVAGQSLREVDQALWAANGRADLP